MVLCLADLGCAPFFLQVVYPGLPSHKQHTILEKMLNPGYGFGGLMGLDMETPSKAEAVSAISPFLCLNALSYNNMF
jgi:cystathionine beta-lyase/cystathionine gamma-synthase